MAEAKLDIEALVNSTFGEHFGVMFDRLRELAEADKDGRCVVLPCKVGDTLFVIERDRTVCHNGCKFDEYSCQGCEEERCDSKLTYKIVPRKNQSLMTIASFMQSGCFGKTAFLTRESAEAALEARL